MLGSALFLQKKLVSMGEFLTKFTESSLFTFSVKDLDTQKIIMNNKECAKIWGLENQGLAGMTSGDCLDQVPYLTNKEEILKDFKHEEMKAIHSDKTQIKIITVLDHKGLICVRQHMTIPICSLIGKKIAIAAICQHLTAQTNLLSLLQLYRQHYTKIKTVQKIWQHLRLEYYFQKPLTFAELSTLLAMTQAPKHKEAARLLYDFRTKPISSTTISKYVETIKNKLKPHIDLYTLLGDLCIQQL